VAAVVGSIALGAVAAVGLASPPGQAASAGATLPVAGAAAGRATAAAATSAWPGLLSGPDPLDLVLKGALVAGLLYITLRVLRRMQGGAPKDGARLAVLETRTIAPKASLHLVAIGERRLVVGLTPSGMVALAELDAAEVPDAGPAVPDAGPGVPDAGPGVPDAIPASARKRIGLPAAADGGMNATDPGTPAIAFDAVLRGVRSRLHLVP
jgi:hypothetical protein